LGVTFEIGFDGREQNRTIQLSRAEHCLLIVMVAYIQVSELEYDADTGI
jgi:hypothetical protein